MVIALIVGAALAAGLTALTVLLIHRAPPSSPEVIPHADALTLAARMSARAWEAEQAMWHAAVHARLEERS